MPATTIVKVSGDNQVQGIGSELTLPLTVRITDGTTGVSGTTVTFTIASKPTNASLQSLRLVNAESDSNGIAQCFLRLGELSGKYTVTATVSGLTGSPITFTAQAISVVSLDEVKQYHGMITDTADDKDNVLCQFIGIITELIENEIGQPVSPREITEYLDANNLDKIYLNQARAISLVEDANGSTLTAIQYRTDATSSWTNLLTDESYIFIDPTDPWAIQLLDGYVFSGGYKRGIRINYNGGFYPIPQSIRKMALEMVEIMMNESKNLGEGRLGLGSVSQNVGGGNTNTIYKEMMNGRWGDVIAHYRKLSA